MIRLTQNQQLEFGRYLVLLIIFGIMTSPPLANFFMAVLLIWSVIFEETRSRFKKIIFSRVGYVFLAWCTSIIIAPIHSKYPQIDIFSSLWGWRKVLMFPIVCIYYFNTPINRLISVKIFLIMCLFFGIISFFEIIFLKGNGVVIRNYVTQGLFFSISTLIAGLLAVETQNWKAKTCHTLICIFFITNIASVYGGRSSYIALMSMLILAIAINHRVSNRNKILGVISTIIIICSIFLTTPQSKDRIISAYNEIESGLNKPSTSSSGLRILFWANTIPIIQKNPLLGVGTGGFESAYKEHVQNKSGVEATITGDPHNQYLKILAEQGAIGLISFLSFLLLLTKNRSHSEITDVIGLCTLFAWSITSLANSHFSTFNEGQFIWIWLGLLLPPIKNA